MLEKRTLTLSIKELDRCVILKMTEDIQNSQREGNKRIDVSERHFRRLLHNYQKKGAEGIISGHRGRASSDRMSKEISLWNNNLLLR